MDQQHQGGCRCGAVRYQLLGEPFEAGLCHCTECRKETGSPFLYFADWTRDAFTVTGEYKTYKGRSFCPQCGGTLFHLSDDHVEVALGSLDEAPVAFVPQLEGWIKRREPWLIDVQGAGQFREDPLPRTFREQTNRVMLGRWMLFCLPLVTSL
jgi:hypothetical protein